MKKSETFLGIWWSGSFLKIIEGTFIDTIRQIEIIDIIKIEGLSDNDIKEKVKSVSKKGRHYSKIVLFVSRRNVIERFIEIPSVKKDEIQNMISLQLEHHFPYSINEMYYDFVSFHSEKNGYSNIALTAISKNECDKMLGLLSSVGINVDLISVSTWGIISAYKNSSLCNSSGKNYVLLVDSDFNQSEVVLMYGERVIYTRSIAHEAKFMDPSLQSSFFEHLMNELNHTLDTVKQENNFTSLNSVILGPTLSSLSARFKKYFSKDTAIVNIEDYYKITILGNRDNIRKDNLSILPFYALSQLYNFPVVDLLPSELKAKSRLRESAPERLRAIVIFVIFFFIIGVGIIFHFQSRYRYLRNFEQKLNEIDPEAKKVSGVIKKIRVIDEVKQGKIIPLELLAELYRIIPSKVYITILEYDVTEGVNIRGFAVNITQVSDLLLILQKSLYFSKAEIKFAKQKVIKGQEGVDFEIFCPYFTVRE